MVGSTVPPFAAYNRRPRVLREVDTEVEQSVFDCGTGVHCFWNEFPSDYHRCY